MEMQEHFTVSFQEPSSLFHVPKAEDAGLRCVYMVSTVRVQCNKYLCWLVDHLSSPLVLIIIFIKKKTQTLIAL